MHYNCGYLGEANEIRLESRSHMGSWEKWSQTTTKAQINIQFESQSVLFIIAMRSHDLIIK